MFRVYVVCVLCVCAWLRVVLRIHVAQTHTHTRSLCVNVTSVESHKQTWNGNNITHCELSTICYVFESHTHTSYYAIEHTHTRLGHRTTSSKGARQYIIAYNAVCYDSIYIYVCVWLQFRTNHKVIFRFVQNLHPEMTSQSRQFYKYTKKKMFIHFYCWMCVCVVWPRPSTEPSSSKVHYI